MTMQLFNHAGRLALVLGAGFLTACHVLPPSRDPDYAATRPPVPAAPAQPSGSIYLAATGMTLFEDTRPRRVGDILTVKLVEATNATKSASTNSKKEASTAMTNPALFGTSVIWNAPPRAPFANTSNLDLSASLSSDQEFKGEGGSSQKNSLTGSITVTIAEVLPNGNLVVRGEKLITINQGHEHVRLAGIVRPQDIQADNSVLSTLIADARITYGGQGALADANSPGWLSRFFNSPWWPF
jgi:flagellar L-ring protein precursor FlgH